MLQGKHWITEQEKKEGILKNESKKKDEKMQRRKNKSRQTERPEVIKKSKS